MTAVGGSAIAYYALGGIDTDLGAMIGSQTDERQTSIGVRARAFSGCVIGFAGVVGCVITTTLGTVTWPFELFCGIGVVSYLAGLAIFRNPG